MANLTNDQGGVDTSQGSGTVVASTTTSAPNSQAIPPPSRSAAANSSQGIPTSSGSMFLQVSTSILVNEIPLNAQSGPSPTLAGSQA